MHPRPPTPNTRPISGFSLIELTVVGGLVAALFVTIAVVFRTVGQNQGRSVSFQPVVLGKAITNAFFPDPAQRTAFGASAAEMPASIDVMGAPHFGTEYEVGVMREYFNDDVMKSCGVFVLPRGPISINAGSAKGDVVQNLNHIHPPVTIDAVDGVTEIPPFLPLTRPASEIDHPNAFLDLLLALYPDTPNKPFPFLDRSGPSAVTGYYRGVPSAQFVNASIYIIQPSHRTDMLMVRSVWDIDLVRVDASEGVFASVRRYFGEKLTHFYHVLYQDPKAGATMQPGDFGPIMACFERSIRLAVTEGVQADAFKVAPSRPFYMIWWPSPAIPTLRGHPVDNTLPATDPRSYYTAHEHQTNLMFTVPLFPTL